MSLPLYRLHGQDTVWQELPKIQCASSFFRVRLGHDAPDFVLLPVGLCITPALVSPLQTRRRRRSSDRQRGRVRAACDPDPVEVYDGSGLCAGDVHQGLVQLRLSRVPIQSRVRTTCTIPHATRYIYKGVQVSAYTVGGGTG